MNINSPTFNDFLTCKGMLFTNRMRIYSFSHHCFEMNMGSLVFSLEQLSDPEFTLEIWDIEKRGRQEFIFQEVIRHFHNMVSSAKSLVEHTRLFVNENYNNTEFIKFSYHEKIQMVFSNNGNAAVIEDLRNYFMHAGIPPLKMHLSLSSHPDQQEMEMSNKVLLELEILKSWGHWKARSKKYLAALPGDFDLLALVSEYRATVNDFHRWFSDLLHKHHAKDIEELHALDAAIRGITKS